MNRPLQEAVADLDANPADWEAVRAEAVPSTNRRNRGGTSVQQLFRHRATGEELVRHSLLKPDGTPFDAPHYRREWK